MTVEELFAYIVDAKLRDDITIEIRPSVGWDDRTVSITMYRYGTHLLRHIDTAIYSQVNLMEVLDSMRNDLIAHTSRG